VIVVVGSEHDPAARTLVEEWPGAALCSASDMTTAGWSWSPTGSAGSRWVVAGAVVADTDVSGVFLRRAAFHADEFTGTHPDDRAFVAAEVHAFLADVLASTSAVVSAPVGNGTFGDELLAPSHWMRAADAVGLDVVPVRVRSGAPAARRRRVLRSVEIVGRDVIGDRSKRTLTLIADMVEVLGLRWATTILDGRDRVVSVTSAAAPSPDARPPLHRLLGGAPCP
jgi:hypothetical protein